MLSYKLLKDYNFKLIFKYIFYFGLMLQIMLNYVSLNYLEFTVIKQPNLKQI